MKLLLHGLLLILMLTLAVLGPARGQHPGTTVKPVAAADPGAAALSPAQLDALVSKADSTDFSGRILIRQGDRQLLDYRRGQYDKAAAAPITNDTRFNVGSIGKSLTGLLIMQAVEKGKLDLDKTADHYLPEKYRFPNSDQITLRHLLTHTSGLGNFFDSPDFNEQTTLTIDDHLKLIQKMPLLKDTPGGADLLYSNSGFIVLGKILEVLHGKPYQEIVRERLLISAGIGPDRQDATYAKGYWKDGKRWAEGDPSDPRYWTSAGGLFLTAEELHRVAVATMVGKYLSAASLEQLFKQQSRPAQDPPFVGYGLGWMVETPGGLTFLGHNGGVKGAQAAFRYEKKNDLYVYVLSNHDGGAEDLFMTVLMALMEGDRQP